MNLKFLFALLHSMAILVAVVPLAKAEEIECKNIDINTRRIGDVCVVKKDIQLRAEQAPASGVVDFAAENGYVIVATDYIDLGKTGDYQTPSCTNVREGSRVYILSQYSQNSQQWQEFYQSSMAKVDIKGVSVGGIQDLNQKTSTQFSDAIDSLTKFASNWDAIHCPYSARPVYDPFGLRKAGGSLSGYLKIYQRYVGSSSRPNQILSDSKQQFFNLIEAEPISNFSIIGNWTGSPDCPIVFTKDSGTLVEGSCNNASYKHTFRGRYVAPRRIDLVLTRVDPANCSTSVNTSIFILNNNQLLYRQGGWDGCGVKTQPGEQNWTRGK
jgi:hypothetical protein